jgi:hypothetical protein
MITPEPRAGFQGKVALAAIKGEKTLAEHIAPSSALCSRLWPSGHRRTLQTRQRSWRPDSSKNRFGAATWRHGPLARRFGWLGGVASAEHLGGDPRNYAAAALVCNQVSRVKL